MLRIGSPFEAFDAGGAEVVPRIRPASTAPEEKADEKAPLTEDRPHRDRFARASEETRAPRGPDDRRACPLLRAAGRGASSPRHDHRERGGVGVHGRVVMRGRTSSATTKRGSAGRVLLGKCRRALSNPRFPRSQSFVTNVPRTMKFSKSAWAMLLSA